MNNETQEVTITVPKPPKGWVIENGRLPKDDCEPHMMFNGELWKGPYTGTTSNDKHRILAFPAPKRKRLMTPQELAGKWLWLRNQGAYVVGIGEKEIYTHGTKEKVEDAHRYGWLYSVTPTSERLPLEIEDDQ